MQLLQRSSQAKPDINASLSSLESETVSIPCPAESDTDLESAEPIVPSASLSRHDIIDMDRASYKIGKKFKRGNNLMTISKQKYILVDDMINHLTSENCYLYSSDEKHVDKIMTFVCHELDLAYSTKHLRMQMKLYPEEHFESLKIFAKKYLMQRNVSLHQYIDTLLPQPNFVDELMLILLSQRYSVHIAVLTEGNGYWCTK